MINNNLIFDLGFHDGTDTKLYLERGYNVIAIEANPELVKDGLNNFKSEINSGQLILLNKAISNIEGKINFYIHPNKSDWSSCFKNIAESDGSKSKYIKIKSITIDNLFKIYGTPYYIKVDIEGYDSLIAKSLIKYNKPDFISFEISKTNYYEIFSYLFVVGYRKFQLRNQLNNSQYSSGEFGKFLPNDRWISYNELLTRYIKYKDLKIIDNEELGLGWLDVHAMMEQ